MEEERTAGQGSAAAAKGDRTAPAAAGTVHEKKKYINTVKTGRNISRLIVENGLTLKEVKEKLGLSTTATIYKWIEGYCLPNTDNLYQLSALFGIPINEILVVNSPGP